jgi:tetratricopeptide (TPR) repeat protein
LGQPIAAPRDDKREVIPEQLSKWTIYDPDPVRSIPTPEQRDADPLEFGYFLMDLSDRAEAALKVGKFKKALPYFDAMAKAVPNRSISYAKLCMCYRAIDDWKSAEEQCSIALQKDGVRVEDFLAYAGLLFEKKSHFGPEETEKITAVIQHVRQQLPTSTLADELQCQLGLKLEDAARLKDCTQRLAASAPTDPKTMTYQWSYAMLRGDTAEAKRIIDHARRTSAIPAAALSKMEESTRHSRFTARVLVRNSWFLATAAVLLASGFLVYVFVARRRQLAVG